ncbi:MAG: PAS domain-containing protein [Thermoplasmata archaeon]
MESIIKTLPFELTFIDSEDRLRYFTNNNNT